MHGGVVEASQLAARQRNLQAMLSLSRLEKAVLEKMLSLAASDCLPLSQQLDGAAVVSRQNTGAGFYARLEPSDRSALIKSRTIGGVFARISGLTNPMTFVLFIKNGLIEMLEGASVDDDTSGIDFTSVRFETISFGSESRQD